MAIIKLNDQIPNNIVEIPLTEPTEIRKHFERGDVVIISDRKIDADFENLSKLQLPNGSGVRKEKYVFTKKKKNIPDDRSSIWRKFGDLAFPNDTHGLENFQNHVKYVDDQIDHIVRMIFNKHKFIQQFITWKFQKVEGENIHIDNLKGSNEFAQARLFVNLDSSPRHWSVGRHWRYYAEHYFEKAELQAIANDPYKFNGLLTQAAFGPSWASCEEPRHFIEFAPGEIWLVNSALVAHQVRKGNLLCMAHYEYPYRQYLDRSASLPAQLRALAQSHFPTRSIISDRLRGFTAYFQR